MYQWWKFEWNQKFLTWHWKTTMEWPSGSLTLKKNFIIFGLPPNQTGICLVQVKKWIVNVFRKTLIQCWILEREQLFCLVLVLQYLNECPFLTSYLGVPPAWYLTLLAGITFCLFILKLRCFVISCSLCLNIFYFSFTTVKR